MAEDSELYDWRDRSDTKMIPLANASSLRWCSKNKGKYGGGGMRPRRKHDTGFLFVHSKQKRLITYRYFCIIFNVAQQIHHHISIQIKPASGKIPLFLFLKYFIY